MFKKNVLFQSCSLIMGDSKKIFCTLLNNCWCLFVHLNFLFSLVRSKDWISSEKDGTQHLQKVTRQKNFFNSRAVAGVREESILQILELVGEIE